MTKKKTPQTLQGVSEHRKNFTKLLNQFNAHGYNRFNVFNDWLHMFAISLSNQSDPYHLATDKATFDQREETYKRIISKYKPELQELFPQMCAEIVLECESYCPNDFCDVLGELFHSLEFTDSWTGQFFTPQDVCNAMGRIQFSNVDTLKTWIDEKGFISVDDPASGGGALILGAANAMTYHGFNPQKQMLSVCNDIDARCVHMCYVQLSLYGLPAIVQRQNSLSLEVFDKPWFTPIFVLDGWTMKTRRALRKVETIEESHTAKSIKPTKPQPKPTVEPPRYEQLSLF